MNDNRIQEVLRCIPDNKIVLDLGCAQNPEIHFTLAKRCKKIVGVDINAKGIEYIKKKGLEAYVMDVEQIKLKDKFDYIVAGELIEHLNNPGLFLKSMKKHLRDDGKIILTTPNISSVLIYILVVIFDRTQDPTHVYYFDKKNLEVLINRYGLAFKDITYVQPEIKIHGNGIIFRIAFFIAVTLANIGFIFSKRLFGSYILATIIKKNNYEYQSL